MKLTVLTSRVTRLLMPVGAIMLLMLVNAGAASAHTQLLDSDPANGASLKTAPEQIVLTFEEAPLDQGLAMAAVGPDGGNITLNPHVEGAKVVALWPAAATAGAYRVNWRVVADDGHPVSGALGFSIASDSSSSAQSTPAASAMTAASPAPTATGSQGSFPMWLLIPIGVLVMVVAAVALRQVRRTPDE